MIVCVWQVVGLSQCLFRTGQQHLHYLPPLQNQPRDTTGHECTRTGLPHWRSLKQSLEPNSYGDRSSLCFAAATRCDDCFAFRDLETGQCGIGNTTVGHLETGLWDIYCKIVISGIVYFYEAQPKVEPVAAVSKAGEARTCFF